MKSFRNFVKEAAFSALIILAIYVAGTIIWYRWGHILVSLPVVSTIYRITMYEVQRKSVVGLSIISFVGGLFFIGYPGELVFLVYGRAQYNIFFVAFIMTLYSMIAQVINYYLGVFLDAKILNRFIKNSQADYLSSMQSYGVLFILVFNILPLPGDLLTTFLGMIRYDFRNTMVYSLIGKVVKALFLIVLVMMSRGEWFFL